MSTEEQLAEIHTDLAAILEQLHTLVGLLALRD